MSRSLDTGPHEAYAPLFEKLMAGLSNGESTLSFSTPESIAEIVYEAATDGKDQLRYLAGNDAVGIYEQRLKIGAEDFRRGVAAGFGV